MVSTKHVQMRPETSRVDGIPTSICARAARLRKAFMTSVLERTPVDSCSSRLSVVISVSSTSRGSNNCRGSPVTFRNCSESLGKIGSDGLTLARVESRCKHHVREVCFHEGSVANWPAISFSANTGGECE